MKLQLDTTNKTIKIEESVNLKELIELLEKLLPKGLWKEFKLESNVTINNWCNPIIIKEVPSSPYYWYNNAGTINLNSTDGSGEILEYQDKCIYNLEIS